MSCLITNLPSYEVWVRKEYLTDHKYGHGECKFSDLTQHEYFDIMEDLAIEFYQTGKPDPSEIHTEIQKGN